MNCEDVPMSEWDKLTGAAEEVKESAFIVPALINKQGWKEIARLLSL